MSKSKYSKIFTITTLKIGGAVLEKISIIIPVYNSAKYLQKCLDSIINQNYKNLEILLVNDGSTDNSGNICDEYAAKDIRIRAIHKPNGGVSSARNAGLMNCTGDYIGFVDSDDWVEPGMYEILYRTVKDNNADFSTVNYFMDYADHTELMTARERIPTERAMTKSEMLLYMSRGFHYAGFFCSVCNKLFKAALVLENRLSFDENLTSGEDAKLLAKIILTDDCIGFYNNKPLYHYRQRADSCVHSGSSENMTDSITALNDIIIMAESIGFSNVTLYFKRQHCYNASLLAEKAIEEKDTELLKLSQEKIGVYINEYMEANKDYPDYIERIYALFHYKDVRL